MDWILPLECEQGKYSSVNWRRFILGFVTVIALFLSGCKSDLYTGLAENDANRMLAELLTSGISAEKVISGKDGFAIRVNDRDILKSLALLESRGLPSVSHTSINEVFQKSGIMSSPFEEKVRYISTLGDEIARTISLIDGVVTARVHIVQPDPPQLGRQPTPSSAAVFIKHQAGVDLDFFLPQIRRLVSSSIEGLDYGAVTVILSEAVPLKADLSSKPSETVEVFSGISVGEADAGRFWKMLYILMGTMCFLIMAIIAGAYFFWKNKKEKITIPNDAPSPPETT